MTLTAVDRIAPTAPRHAWAAPAVNTHNPAPAVPMARLRFGQQPLPLQVQNPAPVPPQTGNWLSRQLENIYLFFYVRRPLFRRFGINPSTIPVVGDVNLLPIRKEYVVGKALEAHEMAWKNRMLGNYTRDYRATHILLNNGQWGLGTNLEFFNTNDTLCGERTAIVSTLSKAIRGLKLEDLKRMSEPQLEKIREGLKIKMLVMTASSKEDHIDICSECENWLTSKRYFTPQTVTVSLQPQADKTFALEIGTLGQRFPQWPTQGPSIQSNVTLPLTALPIEISPTARAAMAQRGVTAAQIKRLMTNAKQAFLASPLAEFSGCNLSTSVLMSTGKTYTASKVEWKRRWYEAPDLRAAANGYQDAYLTSPHTPVRVEALAYYGNDQLAPTARCLGRLAQGYHGGQDTLVAVIQNDKLAIRTIQDYIPKTYVSTSRPKYAALG